MQLVYSEKELASPEEAFADLASLRGDNWIYASSAITLNGQLKVEQKPFGGEGDWRWYNIMREYADYVIIGGATMRQSGPKTDSRYQHGAGKPQGKIVILTSTGDIPMNSPLFSANGPVAIYTSSDKEFVCANDNLEVKRSESWSADSILADLGPGRVMVDGGGEVYSMFAQKVEDWMLTIVPVFASNNQPSLWKNAYEIRPELRWAWEQDGRLFTRYSQH